MRRLHLWLGLATALLLTSGCGETAPPAAGDTPLTARAIAAVVLDHLGEDTSSREATYVDEHSPDGLVGAALYYDGEEGSPGGRVAVTVAHDDPPACDEQCDDLSPDTRLTWSLDVPEEDPGNVKITYSREDEVVTVLVSGPTITGDPRTMTDLAVSIDDMVALAQDPRLRLSTTAEVVAEGEEVTDWEGGEVPAGDLDEVPHTDKSLAISVLGEFSRDWTYLGPSPFKAELGEGAIAGRLKTGRDFEPIGPAVADVFVAPVAPAWARDACEPGYTCVDLGDDEVVPADDDYAGIRLMWRPAAGDDPGEAWYVTVREDGSMAGFHVRGPRLSDAPIDAGGSAGLFLWGSTLLHEDWGPYVDFVGSRRQVEAAERR